MGTIDNLMPYWGQWDVFDAGDVEEFTSLMDQYGDAAQRVINNVLHKEGAQEIKKEITHLLPASGRNWKGKGASARSAMPGKSTTTCIFRMMVQIQGNMWEIRDL